MKNLKNIMYSFASIIFGLVIIYISELIGLSHLNLAPFGGKSWALWFHPLSFVLSFFILGKIFKIKNLLTIVVISFFIFMILFFWIYNGKIFNNFVPFG